MYIGCNVTYSDYFDDGTLRTFLTYGIDRQSLVDNNYGGCAAHHPAHFSHVALLQQEPCRDL